MTTACIVAGSDGIIVKAPRVREDRREPAVMVHTIWEPNPRGQLGAEDGRLDPSLPHFFLRGIAQDRPRMAGVRVTPL